MVLRGIQLDSHMLAHVVLSFHYPKQKDTRWFFCFCLLHERSPMGPFVSSRIQSSTLDSQVGRFILLCCGPNLLIGKSCLASSQQLCWDLDGKCSISPHSILLWLSCRIMVQSSNVLAFFYSAGSSQGHMGPCIARASRTVLCSGLIASF